MWFVLGACVPPYICMGGGLSSTTIAQDAITRHQPVGPYTLVGFSHAGSRLALDIAARLGRCLAVLVDGTPRPSQCPLPLHDGAWYSLYYLVREASQSTLSFGQFVDGVAVQGADAQEAAIQRLRPRDVGEQVWSAAVGRALQQAERLRVLALEEDAPMIDGRRHIRIVAAAGIAAEAERVQVADAVTAVMVVPEDRFGAAFANAVVGGRVVVVHGSVHSELLLCERGWNAVADAVAESMREAFF